VNNASVFLMMIEVSNDIVQKRWLRLVEHGSAVLCLMLKLEYCNLQFPSLQFSNSE